MSGFAKVASMTACADHERAGNGEPSAVVLKARNPGSRHRGQEITRQPTLQPSTPGARKIEVKSR